MPNPSASEAPPAADDAAGDGPTTPAPDDDAAAERYLEIKATVDADPEVAKGAQFPQLKADLEAIANGAGAPTMRANAALLLGSLFDVRGESLRASGYYQHAATLVPDDAGPHMALAVALASTGDFEGAVKAQQQAATLDPDNLENWLALGELHTRAGHQDEAVQAYVGYELRRKGLIDGLTLHDEAGTYVVGVEERIGCASALAAAADQGTGVALVYALRTDPDPTVREAVARVMGVHRLDLYLPVLQTQAKEEADADVKEAVSWALAEIARDPVRIDPTERPRLPDDDPRAAQGEVPRAEAAPEALTEASTLAPAAPAAADGGGAPPAVPSAPKEAPEAKGEPAGSAAAEG
ncbi:MAG: hypothetical protein KC501_27265 [Myxococcales bacterium]|nr:hypothetical protein [Myxococcales bacterium]